MKSIHIEHNGLVKTISPTPLAGPKSMHSDPSPRLDNECSNMCVASQGRAHTCCTLYKDMGQSDTNTLL